MTPLEEFNRDSKDYLTRSMRILESCTSTWPVPDMQARIDALREAFSADTSRPFELKPSFPYGSPSSSVGLQPSPPPDDHLAQRMLPHQESLGQSHQVPYNAQPITPPVSAGFDASKGNPLSSASMPMMSSGQQQQLPVQTTSVGNDQVEWNPTPIFKYDLTLNILMLRCSYLPVHGTPRSEHQLLLWFRQQCRCHSNHLPISIRLHPFQLILFLLFNHSNPIPSKHIQCLQKCHPSLEVKPHRSYLLSQTLPRLL